MSKIVVDTQPYRSSHGAEPRGRGSWAFTFKPERADGFTTTEEIWFTPSVTYAEARKMAIAQAKERKVTRVWVQP